MRPQIEEAAAGTNCGGPKLVAVQSYSLSTVTRPTSGCNAASHPLQIWALGNADEPIFCHDRGIFDVS